MFNKQKGFMHLAPLLIIVVLAGAWYLHKSFKENRLHEDVGVILRDYRAMVTSFVTKEEDKKQVEIAMKVVEDIVQGQIKELNDDKLQEMTQKIGEEVNKLKEQTSSPNADSSWLSSLTDKTKQLINETTNVLKGEKND